MRLIKARKRQMAGMALIVAASVLLLMGCTNHYLTKEMLFEQMFPHQNLQPKTMPLIVGAPGAIVGLPVRYDSNKLSKIMCYNQKREKVYLSVDQNTQLIITDRKGGARKFYMDTVFLENGVLYGLRSRILGTKQSVPVDEIDKIEIYDEGSRETRLR